MQYTITLADGRKLPGLGKNGDNFVSPTKVDETIFLGNLSTMTVSDGENTETYRDMVFIQQMEWNDGTFYLAFREKTPQEKLMEAITSAEDALCEQDISNDARMSAIEDAVCELDSIINGGGGTNE